MTHAIYRVEPKVGIIMLRQEVLHLKLMLVVTHAILMVSSLYYSIIAQDFVVAPEVNAISILLLFILHGYTYLVSRRLNVEKSSHLVSVIALVMCTNFWLYLIAFGWQSVELYKLHERKPQPVAPARISQK